MSERRVLENNQISISIRSKKHNVNMIVTISILSH